MCQFRLCQSLETSKQELFHPITSETAATIRAGWWAYHVQHSQNLGDSYHMPSFNLPSQASPHLDTVTKRIPSYSYGYGTDL